MDRNTIRNVIIYVINQNGGRRLSEPLCGDMYNSEWVDELPLDKLIQEFNLDELDVVDFLIELESIFNTSILLEDFYKLNNVGDLVTKILNTKNS